MATPSAPAPVKLSFSLKGKSKATAPSLAPKVAAPGFGPDDDDEAQLPSSQRDQQQSTKKKSSSLVPTQAVMTKAMKRQMEEQKKIDSTVYEYDAVFDQLKEAERRAQAVKDEEAKLRQPKYIGALLQSSEVRKLDHLRAEEKMIALEREKEGDQFADKEKFVTQAYKDQLAATKAAEEEEKKREELAKKQRGIGSGGMSHFYRTLLMESNAKHEAAVAGTQKAIIGPTLPTSEASFAVRRPDQEGGQEEPIDVGISDLEKARLAKQQGKDVELNDDNQIVDKRELLSAGLNLSLNLSAKNTRNVGTYRKNRAAEDNEGSKPVTHTAVGAAASKREIDARRRREIEIQEREERERVAKQREEEERANRERVVKRRNDDESVQSALERYRERKRRKLEEEANKPPTEE